MLSHSLEALHLLNEHKASSDRPRRRGRWMASQSLPQPIRGSPAFNEETQCLTWMADEHPAWTWFGPGKRLWLSTEVWKAQPSLESGCCIMCHFWNKEAFGHPVVVCGYLLLFPWSIVVGRRASSEEGDASPKLVRLLTLPSVWSSVAMLIDHQCHPHYFCHLRVLTWLFGFL